MKTLNNTHEGFIQEVEIYGNTIQDPNTLEITSLGQVIEGTSGVKIDISSCNKNLFDGEYKIGYAIGIEPSYHFGQYYASANYSASSNFIKVKQNTRYKGNKTRAYVIEYDAMYNPIRLSGSYTEFTMSTNAKYIKFYIQNADKEGFMIEESTIATATTFAEHEDDNKEIILPCKMDGFEGSRDRLYYDGNEWIVDKNIEYTIINSSFSMGYAGSSFENEDYITFNVAIPGRNFTRNILSTKFKAHRSDFGVNGEKIWGLTTINQVYVMISKLKLPTQDLAGFKKWLEDNPIPLYYQPLEPQIIKTGITDPNLLSLKTYEPKTHIYFVDGMGAEGTIKCKVSKSLEASVSVNTKSIEGVKQELDNVKSLVDTVGTMEVTSDTGFVSVDDTIDGYVDDVEVRGKSLINLWGCKSSDFALSGGSVFSNSKIIYSSGSNPTRWNNFFAKNLSTLKPNTEYTIVTNVIKNNLTQGTILINNPNGDTIGGFATPIKIQSGSKGIFINKISTRNNFDELTDKVTGLRSYFDNTNLQQDILVELQIIILEGDHTSNPPSYFEGLMSVGQDKEIEVLSCNKNLFDSSKLSVSTEKGTFQFNDNKLVYNYTGEYPSVRVIYSNLELFKGKSFKLGFSEYTDTISNNNSNIRFITTENGVKKFYPLLSNGKNMITTLPENLETLEFSIVPNNSSTDKTGILTITNLQLCYLDNFSETYMPHQSNKRTLLKPVIVDNVTTYEPIILRGIDDNVYDSIEKHSDKYKLFEKCGEINLDGSDNEKWIINSTQPSSLSNTHIGFVYNVNIDNAYNGGGQSKLICDRFQHSNDYHNFGELIKWINSSTYNKITIVIEKSKLSTPDVAGFRLWLQSNPIIVIYQLAKPAITELPYDLNLRTYANKTNLVVNAGVINPQLSFKITPCIANTLKTLIDKNQANDEIIQELYMSLSIVTLNALNYKLNN